MIISEKYPPNFKEIEKEFKLTGMEIFTYGNTIFNPNKREIDSALLAHELVHTGQQGDSPGNWWKLYLKDKAFRAYQEIPAYQMQYQTAQKHIKDRTRLHNYLKQLAINLSGETYGKMVSFQEAYDAIKKSKLFILK